MYVLWLYAYMLSYLLNSEYYWTNASSYPRNSPLIKEPTLNNHISPFLPSFYFFLTKFLILIRIRTNRNLVSSWSYIKVVLITPITGLWTYKLKESYWNKQSAITQTKYKVCIDLFSQKGKVGVKVPILQLRTLT